MDPLNRISIPGPEEQLLSRDRSPIYVHAMPSIASIVVSMILMCSRRPVVGKVCATAYPSTSPKLGLKAVRPYVYFGVPHLTRRKMRS